MIERIDWMEESWLPDGAWRVDFLSGPVMEEAGIPMDLSETADQRFMELLGEYFRDAPPRIRIGTPGYRYGPAAGGDDYTFVELLLHGLDLAAKLGIVAGFVSWLKKKGALEIRMSEPFIEELAKWESARRGLGDNAEVIALTLLPGRGETPWGTPRQAGGYSVVLRLEDDRLAVLLFELDGRLKEVSIDGRQAASDEQSAR